jgi:hypothetical protein
MRRKAPIIVNVRDCERRRYWRRGVVVDVEVWQAGRIVAKPPRRLPSSTVEIDYCAAHRTHIYPDLACPHCGERSVPTVVIPFDSLTGAW